MNQEQVSRMSASLFRQLFFMKLLHYEYEYFSKLPCQSGIKSILLRGKNLFGKVISDLSSSMPKGSNDIPKTISNSDEKLRAIHTILEKLFVMSEEDVLMVETHFNNNVKIVHNG